MLVQGACGEHALPLLHGAHVRRDAALPHLAPRLQQERRRSSSTATSLPSSTSPPHHTIPTWHSKHILSEGCMHSVYATSITSHLIPLISHHIPTAQTQPLTPHPSPVTLHTSPFTPHHPNLTLTLYTSHITHLNHHQHPCANPHPPPPPASQATFANIRFSQHETMLLGRRSDLDDSVGYWYIQPTGAETCRAFYSCDTKLRTWVAAALTCALDCSF